MKPIHTTVAGVALVAATLHGGTALAASDEIADPGERAMIKKQEGTCGEPYRGTTDPGDHSRFHCYQAYALQCGMKTSETIQQDPAAHAALKTTCEYYAALQQDGPGNCPHCGVDAAYAPSAPNRVGPETAYAYCHNIDEDTGGIPDGAFYVTPLFSFTNDRYSRIPQLEQAFKEQNQQLTQRVRCVWSMTKGKVEKKLSRLGNRPGRRLAAIPRHTEVLAPGRDEAAP